MRNEKAFTRAKKSTTLRKAVYEYRKMFYNPKNVLSWIYWIILIVYPIILNCVWPNRNIIALYIGDVIGTALAAVVIISFQYTVAKGDIEDLDEWCEDEDW